MVIFAKLGEMIKSNFQSISPGHVQTEFFDSSVKGSGPSPSAGLKEFVHTLPSLKASDIADSVLYVLATPAHVQVWII